MMNKTNFQNEKTGRTTDNLSFGLESLKGPSAEDFAIGENIRRLRRERNLTQHELGNLTGLTSLQIQKYERGTNSISAVSLVVLARELGVDIDEFISEAPDAALAGLV